VVPYPNQRLVLRARERLGRADEALQDFRRAAEAEPHNAEARQAISRLQQPPPPPPPRRRCGQCGGAWAEDRCTGQCGAGAA